MRVKYLPVLLLSTGIFYLSSRPTTALSESQDINTLLFKSAHFIAYALLYLCAVLAFIKKNRSATRTYLYAIAYTILFAISDEVHQLFVPTRTGKISDIFIDIVGISASYLFVRIINMHNMLKKKIK